MFDIVQLTNAYTESHRYYHTLDHITSMFKYATKEGITLSNAQVTAIWWHDFVYNPQSKTNEEDSANKMMEWLEHNNRLDMHVARQIILDTKTHISSLDESKVVLDLDLMGLGSAWEEFKQNTDNVRAEFAHLTEQEWLEGRMNWIVSFCNRDYIFHTEHFRREFEARARSNMSWEFVQLEALHRSKGYFCEGDKKLWSQENR